MEIEIMGEVWWWRGPAPFHFVTVPEAESELIAEIAPAVSYGWGMIPAVVRLGELSLPTSLCPKAGRYVVPLKKALREPAGVKLGDTVTLTLVLAAPCRGEHEE